MKKIILKTICICTILASIHAALEFFDHQQSALAYNTCSWNHIANDEVVFNTKTYKYHNKHCEYAQRCTVNCIRMKRAKAKTMGTPCKVCGG